MFIEFQANDGGRQVSVNMCCVETIAESTRAYDCTTLVFDNGNDKDYLEVNELYESVMAKVRAAQ